MDRGQILSGSCSCRPRCNALARGDQEPIGGMRTHQGRRRIGLAPGALAFIVGLANPALAQNTGAPVNNLVWWFGNKPGAW